MRYIRKWILPSFTIHRHEPDEHPENWGKSFFWYCHICGEQYAWAELYDEDAARRPFNAIGGRCLQCNIHSDRYSIAGSIEGPITMGWHVPQEVAEYQLDCELAFLDHPNHPHNRRVCDG